MPQKMWPPPDSYTQDERANLMPVNQPEGQFPDLKYEYEPTLNGAQFCKYSKELHEPKKEGKKLEYEEEASLYTIPLESRPHGIEIFDDQLVLEFQTNGKLHTPIVVKEPLKGIESQKASMLFPGTIESRHETDPPRSPKIEEVKLKLKEPPTAVVKEQPQKPHTDEKPVPTLSVQPKQLPDEKRSGCCGGGCQLI